MSIILLGKQKDVRKYLNKAMQAAPDGFGLMYYDQTQKGRYGTNGDSINYRTLDPLKFKFRIKAILPDTKIAVHCRYATIGSVNEKNCFPQISPTMGVAVMTTENFADIIIPNNEQRLAIHYWLRNSEIKYHSWNEAKQHLSNIKECLVIMDRNGNFNVLNSSLGETLNAVWVFSEQAEPKKLYTEHIEKPIVAQQTRYHQKPRSNYERSYTNAKFRNPRYQSTLNNNNNNGNGNGNTRDNDDDNTSYIAWCHKTRHEPKP